MQPERSLEQFPFRRLAAVIQLESPVGIRDWDRIERLDARFKRYQAQAAQSRRGTGVAQRLEQVGHVERRFDVARAAVLLRTLGFACVVQQDYGRAERRQLAV